MTTQPSGRTEPGGLAVLGAVGTLGYAPGLLAAWPLEALWRRRDTAQASRWGWAVGGGLGFGYVAPLVSWSWPGALLHGNSPGPVLASAGAELLLAPAAIQVAAWLASRRNRAPVSAPPASAAPPADPPAPETSALVRLGTDTLGRPVALDLRGEFDNFRHGIAGQRQDHDADPARGGKPAPRLGGHRRGPQGIRDDVERNESTRRALRCAAAAVRPQRANIARLQPLHRSAR